MENVLASELPSACEAAGAAVLADFDSIARLNRPRIFRFILAALRDRELAENLTQDALVRAYASRQKFRGDASAGTWLMQIAVNLVRDHINSSRLKFWRRALGAGVDLAALEECLPDHQLSPEALTLARERVRAVWDAAGALPERQRTVFVLRFVEDMELLEIAAVTGMKEGTVKTHLFRALQSVRQRLEAGR